MSHFPPMLSSTPPPVDDQLEDEEDDEFGDFRVADISLNLSTLNTHNDSTESPEPWVKPKSPTHTITPGSLTPDSPANSPGKEKLQNGIGPGSLLEPEDIISVDSINALTIGCVRDDIEETCIGFTSACEMPVPELVLDNAVPVEADFPIDPDPDSGQSWNQSGYTDSAALQRGDLEKVKVMNQVMTQSSAVDVSSEEFDKLSTQPSAVDVSSKELDQQSILPSAVYGSTEELDQLSAQASGADDSAEEFAKLSRQLPVVDPSVYISVQRDDSEVCILTDQCDVVNKFKEEFQEKTEGRCIDDWGEMSSFTEFSSEVIPDRNCGDFAQFSSDSPVHPETSNNHFAAFPSEVGEESGWSEAVSGLAQDTALPAPGPEPDDDDFDEFEFHSAVVQQSEEEGIEMAVKMMFNLSDGEVTPENHDASPSTSCLHECLDDSSSVWGHLKELETSHALSYLWPNSTASQALLSSLNVDSRNILFGPRWNGSVPRFAANLGFSPLEPMKAVEAAPMEHAPDAVTGPVIEEVVPAAQFDWTSSGLTNPLDCVAKEALQCEARAAGTDQLKSHAAHVELSVEACNVIASLPDLSFLSARKLMCVANQDYERYTTRTRP